MSLQKLKNVYFLGSLIKNIKGIYDKVNEIIDYLNGQSGDGSYKVYTALLTQTGTNAPTSIVLQNTLGGNPILTRVSEGSYKLTLSSSFTDNKTFITIIPTLDAGTDSICGAIRLNSNDILITSAAVTSNTLVDDLLSNTSIEIRVYN